MANMNTDAQGVHIIPCSNLKDNNKAPFTPGPMGQLKLVA